MPEKGDLISWAADDYEIDWPEEEPINPEATEREPCWQHKIKLEFLEGKRSVQTDMFPDDIDLSLDNARLLDVPRDAAKRFIETYEWLGTLGNSMFAYGLYFGGKLGAVASFGKPDTWQICEGLCGIEYSPLVIQLNRGACAYWTPENTASRLIALSLKKLEKETKFRMVLASADPRAGEIGTVYQASNWLYIGIGSTGNDFVPASLVNPDDVRFHTRGLPKELKSKRRLEQAGHEVLKVPRARKHRYLAIIGSRKERKMLRGALKYRVLTYPKREN